MHSRSTKKIYTHLKMSNRRLKAEIQIDSPTVTWLEYFEIAPLDQKDQLLGWLITFIDISARKKAESLLAKENPKRITGILLTTHWLEYTKQIKMVNYYLQTILLLIFSDTIPAQDINGIMITSLYKNLNDRDIILKKLKEEGKLEEY